MGACIATSGGLGGDCCGLSGYWRETVGGKEAQIDEETTHSVSGEAGWSKEKWIEPLPIQHGWVLELPVMKGEGGNWFGEV